MTNLPQPTVFGWGRARRKLTAYMRWRRGDLERPRHPGRWGEISADERARRRAANRRAKASRKVNRG